jgi:hypothetical protein
MKSISKTTKALLGGLVLFVIFTSIPQAAAQETCVQPPPDMTGWWPGDGNTNDIVGGRNAVLKNGATFGAGQVGQGFILDGIDDFVDVPHHPALNVGTGDFTVDLWVYFNTTEGEQLLVEKYVQATLDPTTDVFGWSLTKLSDNRLHLVVGNTSGGFTILESDVLTLLTNAWMHVAARRSGSVFTIFLNGTAVASGTSTNNVDSNSSLKFGHRGNPEDTPGSVDTRGFFLNGRIDEVELFVGRALSDAEIQAIFDAGSAGKCKGPVVCVQPPSGLVSWWPGDGNAQDIIGLNDGTLQGGTSFAQGIVGQAFRFDGVDDYIRVPHHPSLNPASALTIEAWIHSASTEGARVIVSKWNDDTGDWSYIFKDHNDSDKLRIELSESIHNDLADLEGSTSIPLGTWIHVATTYDVGEGTVRLYFNGIEDASLMVGPGRLIDSSLTDLLIGAVFTGGGILENFAGLIDEVAIYNRALSAEEIAAIFNAGSAGKCKGGPVAQVPTSTEQCKKGGWMNLTDDAGRPFKNQGDCVSFVATRGKNPAGG